MFFLCILGFCSLLWWFIHILNIIYNNYGWQVLLQGLHEWRYCNFSLLGTQTIYCTRCVHTHASSLLSPQNPHSYPLKEPMPRSIMPKESDYNTVNSEMQDLFVFFIVILNVLPNSVDREKCKAGYCLSSFTSLATCFAATFDELKYCLWSRDCKTPDWNIPWQGFHSSWAY